MNSSLSLSTIFILIIQIIDCLSVKIQHPTLWLKSHRTLLLTSNSNNKGSWRYIVRAHKTKAYKKCLLIQNIDGSTLYYNDSNNSFSVTDNVGSVLRNLNTQMFVLTLNLQAVRINHEDDQRMVQVIRRYIEEDSSSGKDFILIRAVYWPFYLCSDPQSRLYGSAIQNNTLSYDCIWYRVLTSSGYMNLLKLSQIPFYNVTYHNSKALSSYPRNHLNLLTYNGVPDKSSYWAVALSHLSIPPYRYQRSVTLTFDSSVSSRLQLIFDHNKDLKKSIIPLVCLGLDKKIEEEIRFQHRIFQKINETITAAISYGYENISENFEEYIAILPKYYDYKIRMESYINNERLYERHRLSEFINRIKIRRKNLEGAFSQTLLRWNDLRLVLCRSLISSNSCSCVTTPKQGQCAVFHFTEYMRARSSVWARIPRDQQILQALIYRHRYRSATSIMARRRTFLHAKTQYQQFRSTDYYRKAQICL